ncbi:MAG: hypothetical protein AAB071_01320 [Bacteroidota bacterium]
MLRITNIILIVFLLGNIPQALLANERQIITDRIIFTENNSQQCLKCHGMNNFSYREPLTNAIHSYTVARDTFQNSAHGTLSCMQCHNDIKEFPHKFTNKRKIISCGDDCHARDTTGKLISHSSIVQEFSTSSHRKGLIENSSDSPNCLACHNSNPHAIQKIKHEVNPQEKMSLCISCHENDALMKKNDVNTDAVISYKRSFHFKAIKFGETNTAVCQDCHTTHHVLSGDSTQSSVSEKNVASTCGKNNCHPGAQMNFAMSGANHLNLKIDEEPLLKFEEQFFILLTLGSMAMLAVGIVLDIQRKFGWSTLLEKLFNSSGKIILRFGRFVYTFLKKNLVD